MSKMNKLMKKFPEVPIILQRYEDKIRERAEDELSQRYTEQIVGTEAIEAFCTKFQHSDHDLTDDEIDDLQAEVVKAASRTPSLRSLFEAVVYDTLRGGRIWWYLKYAVQMEKAVFQYYAPLMQELTAAYAKQNREFAQQGLDDWLSARVRSSLGKRA